MSDVADDMQAEAQRWADESLVCKKHGVRYLPESPCHLCEDGEEFHNLLATPEPSAAGVDERDVDAHLIDQLLVLTSAPDSVVDAARNALASLRADRDRLERERATMYDQWIGTRHRLELSEETVQRLERELEEARRAHQSLWTRHVEDTKDLMFENRRLREFIAYGGLTSTFEDWRALHAPTTEDGAPESEGGDER